jgi:hypothetical protein
MKHNTQIIDRPDTKITQKTTTSHQNVVGETIKKSSFSNFEDDSQTICPVRADKSLVTIATRQIDIDIREQTYLSAKVARERYKASKRLLSSALTSKEVK